MCFVFHGIASTSESFKNNFQEKENLVETSKIVQFIIAISHRIVTLENLSSMILKIFLSIMIASYMTSSSYETITRIKISE